MTLAALARSTLEMLRPPRAQTVSEWADKNRILVSESSAESGQWRTDRAPYQREIMDSFTQPGIYEIDIISSAQVGKSEIVLNMLGRAIDADPGPILYVQPTDKVAEDYSKRRIAPMLAACPALRRKVYAAKGRDSNNTITLKTFPGGSLAIVGANSPADLASKPIRYLLFDEIDRFPPSVGAEGDPIALAERRTETFRHNRRIVKTSTPTVKDASPIEKAYMHGTQEEWRTQCPHCNVYSFIRFEDIKFDKREFKDEDGNINYSVSNVRWECPLCKRPTAEHEAKRCPGKWVARNEEALKNGVRSFKINAFMSPWSDWGDICLSFLKAGNDPELLKTFHNTMLGESWEWRDKNGVPDSLYNRREDYLSEVPDEVLVLTMGIDTQDNRLEYEVVGWDRNEQSWGIEYGIIPGRADSEETWAEVDSLLERGFKKRNGTQLRVLATFIDSGGHFTTEVYRECAKRHARHIWPIKGMGGEGRTYVRQMKDTNVKNLVGFIIGVDNGKEAVMYCSGIDKPGPRYMHFPKAPEKGYDREYFKGLISETQVFHRRGGRTQIVWEKTHERNEPLDIRNYARAAYKYFHWNFDQYERIMRGEDAPEITTRAKAEARKNRHIVSKGINV